MRDTAYGMSRKRLELTDRLKRIKLISSCQIDMKILMVLLMRVICWRQRLMLEVTSKL